MPKLNKRAVVIQDLIDIATYISQDNLDAGDRFLYAVEATFQQIAKLPGIGRFSGFTHPRLTQVRQFPVKGFKNYLIYYQVQEDIIDIMHVFQGSQNIPTILQQELKEEDQE
ncbi:MULTISPECIES: type II toxin-antitoxin system RelE/ParE family toxin [unclassified Coleofasciculus]|uniref:type II toxin-antitoxin system RelE/ParE family toxin n=1 Tax=unclassified Coleofasciculus TaxID=2692782 RepID=UPI00187F08A0|nr:MULTISPECIES: type II toxin-antitoxin system RelE/ParE family toxin [unclassified Coleofasciculus]MBE9129379.1 type II toxin-antitoxin system RelE/ParE family toxin [Coleofasciculus sp. LEGE 07081]MBE9152013.1 type II toxin-antitoxin system RelE/ParE family toxin [Coleofasciculus sp. LEGE 07092]